MSDASSDGVLPTRKTGADAGASYNRTISCQLSLTSSIATDRRVAAAVRRWRHRKSRDSAARHTCAVAARCCPAAQLSLHKITSCRVYEFGETDRGKRSAEFAHALWKWLKETSQKIFDNSLCASTTSDIVKSTKKTSQSYINDTITSDFIHLV